jgi:tetratricopeptide (TPR) repeat protein
MMRRRWLIHLASALIVLIGAGLARAAIEVAEADLYDTGRIPRLERKVVFRANAYARRGNFDRAVAVLKEHLAEHPDQDHYLLRFYLAQHLSDGGAREAALLEYWRAVDLEPRLDRAWFGLGDTAYKLGRFDLAGYAFTRGFHASPERPVEIYYYAAAAYLMGREPEKALPALQSLTAGDWGTPKLDWYRALVSATLELEKPELAEPRLAELLASYPDDPDAWYLVYQFRAGTRDFRGAAIALTVVGYLRDLTADEQRVLGDLYAVVGVPAFAADRYAEAFGDEATPDQYERLASAYLAAHEDDRALDVLRGALAEQPTARLYSLLGDIHYLNKDYQKAYEAFAHVAELDPEYGRAYLMQGYAAIELGEKEQALELLEKAARFPDHQEMATALLRRAHRMS